MTLQQIYDKLRAHLPPLHQSILTDFYNEVHRGWGALRGQLADANRTIENHVRTIEILTKGITDRDATIKELLQRLLPSSMGNGANHFPASDAANDLSPCGVQQRAGAVRAGHREEEEEVTR